MSRNRVVVGVIVLLLAASLVGCQQSQRTGSGGSTPTVEQASTYVSIDATAVLNGETVSVTGTATVPDGAVINYSMGEGVHALPGGGVDGAEGPRVVTNGSFHFDQDVTGWPRPIPVYLTFSIKGESTQPSEVIALYGEDGEKMEGPNVRKIPGLTSVTEELTVGN